MKIDISTIDDFFYNSLYPRLPVFHQQIAALYEREHFAALPVKQFFENRPLEADSQDFIGNPSLWGQWAIV